MPSLYTLSLKSNPSDIRYVGITKYSDVSKRLANHKEKAGKVNRPVCDWINKYRDDVIITKISGNHTWDEACQKEIDLISRLRSEGFKLLNMTNGGDGSMGKKDSEETRRKKSESLKGRMVSDETKKKISEANKGSKRSDESKKKMSDAKKGKTLSIEHIDKIRNKLTGRVCSPETAKKISDSQRGRKLSDDHLNNLRVAQRKRREREKREKDTNE